MDIQFYVTKSDNETQKLGEKFVNNLKSGDIVLLYGNLGSGKTTFTKGIARGLGIKARISSPTFTIIRSHKDLHHIDLYRLENKKGVENIGLKEILEDKTSIKIIEWPEKLDMPPKKRWEVRFEILDDARKITIQKY